MQPSLPLPTPEQPIARAPEPAPVHPCLRTAAAIVAAVGIGGLSRRRFALGCGGGRFVVRGYGVTGRGGSWGAAEANWLSGAMEVAR